MLLIVVQIFQVIYSCYIMFLNKKKNMLINMFISNTINLVLFAVAGLNSAFLTTIIIALRSFLFVFRNKYKTNFIFYFCLFLHILSGSLFIISCFFLGAYNGNRTRDLCLTKAVLYLLSYASIYKIIIVSNQNFSHSV